jgi:hypothetical protein
VDRERLVYVQAAEPADELQGDVMPPSPEPGPQALATNVSDDARAADARRMAELRRDVLRWGVDMLPETRSTTSPARPPRDRELENLLRPTPGAFASPYFLQFRPPSIRSGGDE